MNIGYYAHHHGTGHCRQADKLIGHLLNFDATAKNIMTVFTSLSEEGYTFEHITANNIVRLPDEHETQTDVLQGRAGEYWQPECLHYSPVGNSNIQQRSLSLLSQVHIRQIELMIVDVSVEVALLCRTASIPYLYVRLPGSRDDTPHLNAFQGALGLIAAYPRVLESVDTPEWVRQKTLYIGFLPRVLPTSSFVDSEFMQSINDLMPRNNHRQSLIQNSNHPHASEQVDQLKDVKTQDTYLSVSSPVVTVIKGFGGHDNIDKILPKVRQLLPEALIISLGPIADSAVAYVDVATQVDDVFPFLQHSDLLVMACGLNAIGEACQFNTPLLVVPDNRPHDEQQMMAQALIDCGRALSLEQFESYCCQNSLNNKAVNDAKTHNDDSKDIKKVMACLKPNQSLVATLSDSNSLDFMEAIAKADTVKAWFIEWLLPKLAIQPI